VIQYYQRQNSEVVTRQRLFLFLMVQQLKANSNDVVTKIVMKKIEREFGVPVPGEIVDQEKWTKTALKKLPPEGPLDLVALFGRAAPLVVDLGCGNGRFLIGSALRRPEFDHIGIDIFPMVLRYATRRGNQRGLGNLRFAAIDAQRFVAHYLTAGGVIEMHCYHPQPHHDPHDRHKRLLTPMFLVDVHSVLVAGGSLFVQTDNEAYWMYIKKSLPTFFDFHEQKGPWPDTPRGRTRREILALKRRYPIFRGWGVKKDMTREGALDAARSLPLPSFDAGPRRRDLDRLERES
jgi:tRNA (guanine-N7-)-methyltransferase